MTLYFPSNWPNISPWSLSSIKPTIYEYFNMSVALELSGNKAQFGIQRLFMRFPYI